MKAASQEIKEYSDAVVIQGAAVGSAGYAFKPESDQHEQTGSPGGQSRE
jgi:hypothetical protein